MTKKNARRRRGLVLDFRVCAVTVFGVAILQFLLFVAGWITGEHAIEPMKVFAHDARVQLAAMIAPPAMAEPAPRVVLASSRPLPPKAGREAYTTRPIRLVFEPLPPLERPLPVQRPLPAAPADPDFYAELIRDAAAQYDVPVALVEAVVRVESDFNARAVSAKGARGLMQVMPATARRFGVVDPDHLFYPAPNLTAGTKYLAWLLKRYNGDLDLVLAAYNAGEGAVANYRGIPPYRETRDYVRKVRKILARRSA